MYARHMAMVAFFECYKPKHHAFFHLLKNQSLHGNPRRYANWLGEDNNKVLTASCRNLSQLTSERTVLVKMRENLRAQKRGR